MDRIRTMTHHTRPIRIALPPLSDQAAVDILEFLHSAVACFESRYFDQIHRYYADRSEREMCQPDPPPTDDDVPF
jgi:hypothetical protein